MPVADHIKIAHTIRLKYRCFRSNHIWTYLIDMQKWTVEISKNDEHKATVPLVMPVTEEWLEQIRQGL